MNSTFFSKLPARSFSTVQFLRNIALVHNVTVSLAPKYCARTVEANKYEKWEECSHFSPVSVDGSEKIFSIILPPPNITGTLHLGHALTVTIEDILCRWKRMQGYSVVWVPGTDHAGIATQVMVEKIVYIKTGKTRREIGRKLFFEHLLEWKANKMNKITDQLKQLGASLDWPKYTFTMDPAQSAAVSEAVIRLFDDGLIFHESSLVNWCSHLQSTISDIEIDYQTLEDPTLINVPGCAEPIEFGLIYDFAMKIIGPNGESGDEIIVSTTRPETVFGDVAVAVHPNDTRYNHLRDTFLQHPFRECPIPLIFDECADPESGTGAVKITPGHSKKDFEVAKRHDLPVITIFDEFGHLNETCKGYIGENRFLARNQVVSQLSTLGLLRDVKKHRMRIPVCSRSGDIIEQMIRPQWFLKCDELADRAIEAVEKGDIFIEPQKRVQSYTDWLKNTRVWCLSRQLWWGHRLPLYKVGDKWVAAKSPHEAKVKYAVKYGKMCEEVEQETDVLDTWFSSALLPFTVFGWPSVDDDFKKFYPLTLMETGADLLNIWVARMVMLGLYFNEKPPFKKVFLHPMICDSLGRKMSKSLGNIIEPDNVINGISLAELNKVVEANHKDGLLSSAELQKALKFQKETFPNGIQACGADALRLTLAQHTSDQSIFFDAEECVENFRFCNKLWQASKFCIGWASKLNVEPGLQVEPIYLWQKWLLHRLFVTIEGVNAALEASNFSKMASLLKDFLVNDFCDTYVEISKPVLKSDSLPEAKITASVMVHCLETYIRLLSPVMPYICDELYPHIPNCSSKLVSEGTYPLADEYRHWKNESINEDMELVRKVVRSTRSLLQGVRCKNRDSDVVIFSKEKDRLHSYLDAIHTMIRCRSVEICDPPFYVIGPSFVAGNIATVHINMEEMTLNHVTANYQLLNDRIAHWRSILNERIANTKVNSSDSSEENMSCFSSDKTRLFNEWKNFEAELSATLDANGEATSIDDIKNMMNLLIRVQEYRVRFNSALIKPAAFKNES